MSAIGFQGLVSNLDGVVRGLDWKQVDTEWGDYYTSTNYTEAAYQHKCEIVEAFVQRVNPRIVWDLGANTGVFSRIASRHGIPTMAFDADYAAVERNYRDVVKNKEDNLLPLVMDLTNPSADIGWHHRERQSLVERGPADVTLALALVHHLAITNNVPLPDLAGFFADITNWLIIEFIPKEDSQVQRLLATRRDIFTDYHRNAFEAAFLRCFDIHECVDLRDSQRCIYLMQRRGKSHS
jgi:ribosomal protein L11 methylase PrmA